MSGKLIVALSAVALALAGCVSVPTGPRVTVLPGTGKSFEQFRYDEGACRQYAYESIGGQTATQSQQNAAVSSAVIGTAIGALAGAAIGGHGADAAVGAGVGLVGGSMVGASTGNVSAYEAQHRYDVAYTQCMYAKGHRVPVARGYTSPAAGYPAPPAARPPTYSVPPPPPPGAPPPPPPGT
jgi:outer membrane lipoprotein SlyB